MRRAKSLSAPESKRSSERKEILRLGEKILGEKIAKRVAGAAGCAERFFKIFTLILCIFGYNSSLFKLNFA